MKMRVIDFETTGFVEDIKKGKPVVICEIGMVDVDAGTGHISRPFSHLVNCGHPIPPQARAIHHISTEDIASGINPTQAMAKLMEGMEPGDVFVAHNYRFEQAFFGGGSHAWVCTMHCAKHLYPDAPGYGNQTLRYWLGFDSELEWPELAMPAHRAGPDAYVTAHILAGMLRDASVSRLIQLTHTPVLMVNVPFGKHEGRPWSEMDEGYLRWILDPARDFRPDQKDTILHTARHWLNQSNLSGTPFA